MPSPHVTPALKGDGLMLLGEPEETVSGLAWDSASAFSTTRCLRSAPALATPDFSEQARRRIGRVRDEGKPVLLRCKDDCRALLLKPSY
jgi:hypothetical protein